MLRPLGLALMLALLVYATEAQPHPPVRPMPRAASLAVTHQAGPMLGYALHREVVIWAQTTAPAQRWTTSIAGGAFF